eukprot:GHUV01048741.1.p1 GENE.GHUV01048741.1~~GHUV01048741.1.p1  ORF type:complete len:128 (+),score=19.18 GHUV01048741.1:687-1070(+)
MLHTANLQLCCRARLTARASSHSLLPLFGTPVTMVTSPGATCGSVQHAHRVGMILAAVAAHRQHHHGVRHQVADIGHLSLPCLLLRGEPALCRRHVQKRSQAAGTTPRAVKQLLGQSGNACYTTDWT